MPAEGSPFLRHVRDRLPRTRGTLVSDYGFGLVHPGTVGTLLPALQEGRHPLFVDSRLQLRLFRGITAATPNLQEAEATLGEPIGDDPARLRRAGMAMRESLGAEALVMTQGSLGMSVFAKGEEPMHVPVYGTDEVADVTGAGDTVIGALTLAVLAGCRYDEAALLATYASGIVVMKRGTATVSREELRQALSSDAAFERRLRKV